MGEVAGRLLPLSGAEMARRCRRLKMAPVTRCEWFFRGSNDIFLLTLAAKGETVRGVYKPRRGEAPLWDFPDGTLYRREYAAYLIGRALGWPLIPPTVIRDGPHGVGSVQWFVPAYPLTDYRSLLARRTAELKEVAVFDYVVNNADRKAGHCLEGLDGRLWMVDHGLTFNAVPKLRTVIWDFMGTPVPSGLMPSLEACREDLANAGSLRQALSRLLDAAEMDALERRLSRIIETPVFPEPTSYHSVPWPPY